MKVNFNFNLSAWMENVEIEADSYEEAEQKLVGMDIADLIEAGYIHDSDLDSIDGEIIERNIKVHVYEVDYDLIAEDGDIDEEDLPQDLTFTLENVPTDPFKEAEAIVEYVEDTTGYLTNTVYYEIKEEEGEN